MRIPRFLPLLVWISPKAYPDTMIQVQIVYLGVGDLSGEFGQERGKTGRCAFISGLLLWHLGLVFLRPSERLCVTNLRSIPLQDEEAAGGLIPLLLSLIMENCSLCVNSPALPAFSK